MAEIRTYVCLNHSTPPLTHTMLTGTLQLTTHVNNIALIGSHHVVSGWYLKGPI